MATPPAPNDIVVKHNESEHRFEATVAGQLSVCEYELDGNRMVFTISSQVHSRYQYAVPINRQGRLW